MADVPNRSTELGDGEPIDVMCHTGVRSAIVAARVTKQGLPTVANVGAQIDAWSLGDDVSIPPCQ